MQIVRPTLLLNETICRRNIRRMATKAAEQSLRFRPHFKTHQSHTVGRWFRDEGVSAITVSSVAMAAYFAADGWTDITVAFPLNPHEHETINQLASRIRLSVTVVNLEALQQLVPQLLHPLHIFIELDTGYHRTGIAPADGAALERILTFVEAQPLLSFAGFLSHAGHSYASRSWSQIEAIHQESMRLATEVGRRYRDRYPSHVVSVGDTPTCSVARDFRGADEIRPGNFVFYDLTQCAIGSCTEADVAVALACPVVALYPERKEVVVHGGAVHCSKDALQENEVRHYGKVARLTEAGWGSSLPDTYIKSLSQEHGIIHTPRPETFRIGETVAIMPVHSCLMADAMKQYQLVASGHTVTMMQ